jgi:hypothetical protein
MESGRMHRKNRKKKGVNKLNLKDNGKERR